MQGLPKQDLINVLELQRCSQSGLVTGMVPLLPNLVHEEFTHSELSRLEEAHRSGEGKVCS